VTTAIVCDDEPLLREQLATRLAALWPELDIVAACTNGREAVAQVDAQTPDVVFLDIHMPVMNGLEAARLIGRGRDVEGVFKRTHIVFVTAYDEHALAAFERGAIDYVLKPYDDTRLMETIARLKERMVQQGNQEGDTAATLPDNLMHALRQLASQKNGTTPQYLQWIKASVGQTVRLIPVDDVLYFQSDEKYTRVVLADSEVLIRKSIKELLEELDPQRFWQIHRATIVATRSIAGVVRGMRDQADLKLKGRAEILTVSRNYTHLFKQM
jgi:DNA-binding LytR/AlgR family response regulator